MDSGEKKITHVSFLITCNQYMYIFIQKSNILHSLYSLNMQIFVFVLHYAHLYSDSLNFVNERCAFSPYFRYIIILGTICLDSVLVSWMTFQPTIDVANKWYKPNTSEFYNPNL